MTRKSQDKSVRAPAKDIHSGKVVRIGGVEVRLAPMKRLVSARDERRIVDAVTRYYADKPR